MRSWFPLPYLPTPSLAVDVLRRRRYERVKCREEQGQVRQWFLLCGPRSQESLLNPQPGQLHRLVPPADRFWADPFIWKRGEDYFVFCEEWLYQQPHGHIAVMPLSKDGSAVGPSEPVLVKNFHLSYPFLFEWEGKLFMMPEGGAGEQLDVYECVEFPARWRWKLSLMRNVCYADATLFPYQGKWWLFLTLRRGLFSLSRDLFLFWAETPLTDKWTAHPANPVVRGYTGARPAGPVCPLNGRLYRPAQDCLIRYGYGLRVNEILRLDTKRYAERLVTAVKPDWSPEIRAVHHLCWHGGMLAMDTQRLLASQAVGA